MKFSLFSLGLYSIASLIGIASSGQTIASAQCVLADVAVQAAIDGSKRPARQTNQVDIVNDNRPCTGNSSVSTSTQVHVGGTGDVTQERRSTHHLSGGRNRQKGKGGPTVAVPVQVQVDVDNSADRLRY